MHFPLLFRKMNLRVLFETRYGYAKKTGNKTTGYSNY
jgi:hypothetical protein